MDQKCTSTILALVLGTTIGLYAGCRPKHEPVGMDVSRGIIFKKESTEQIEVLWPLIGRTGWEPTPAQVDTLEKSLPAYLKSHQHPNASQIAGRLEGYHRQYLGYFDNGHRMIYVNAFFRVPSDWDWRAHFVFECDGWIDFFQVCYDVEAKTFVRLTVNGTA